MKYRCKICGYIFDEEVEKKKWTEVSNSYVCPMCFVGKEMFAEYREEETPKEKESKRIFEHAVLFDEKNLVVENVVQIFMAFVIFSLNFL